LPLGDVQPKHGPFVRELAVRLWPLSDRSCPAQDVCFWPPMTQCSRWRRTLIAGSSLSIYQSRALRPPLPNDALSRNRILPAGGHRRPRRCCQPDAPAAIDPTGDRRRGPRGGPRTAACRVGARTDTAACVATGYLFGRSIYELARVPLQSTPYHPAGDRRGCV